MSVSTSFYKLRQLFDKGHELSLPQMQQHLQLCERQVRRVLNEFRQQGIILKERRVGKQKLFSVPADRQQVALTNLDLDAAEIRALAIAAKASHSVLIGTPHTNALRRAFEKLLEKARPVTYIFDVEESMQEWHFEDNQTDQMSVECFCQLETAMDEHRSVRMDYLTARDNRLSVGRKIDPYFFAKRQRAWLLVAYCHERKDVRSFSISRVSRVVPCDAARENAFFSVPPHLQPEHFFNASLGAITSGECYELRLLVEPSQALYFRQRQYHPTQILEEERPDGRLVVSYELEGFEEMRSFCQGWGTGITVLAPEILRERLRQEAEILTERYRG